MFCFRICLGLGRLRTARVAKRTLVSFFPPSCSYERTDILGVVIASDIVASDNTLASLAVPDDKLEFVLDLGGNKIHRSGATSYPTNMDGLKMFHLLEPIPEEMFRPVCLPPSGYISRMVKPSSCQKGGGKLLKVGQDFLTALARIILCAKRYLILSHTIAMQIPLTALVQPHHPLGGGKITLYEG